MRATLEFNRLKYHSAIFSFNNFYLRVVLHLAVKKFFPKFGKFLNVAEWFNSNSHHKISLKPRNFFTSDQKEGRTIIFAIFKINEGLVE